MRTSLRFGLVVVLLLIVTAIFISPAVDLEPTALRAMQMANMLFAMLALAGIAVAAHLHHHVSPTAETLECNRVCIPPADIVDLNCTRLC